LARECAAGELARLASVSARGEESLWPSASVRAAILGWGDSWALTRRTAAGDLGRYPATLTSHEPIHHAPCFGALTVESGAYWRVETQARAGCGSGLPRIAYSRKCALDATILVPKRRISPVVARSPSKATRTWRVGTQAERDAAADCLALRFRAEAPSAWRFSVLHRRDPLLWRAQRRSDEPQALPPGFNGVFLLRQKRAAPEVQLSFMTPRFLVVVEGACRSAGGRPRGQTPVSASVYLCVGTPPRGRYTS
jgi:hypothetical protein